MMLDCLGVPDVMTRILTRGKQGSVRGSLALKMEEGHRPPNVDSL